MGKKDGEAYFNKVVYNTRRLAAKEGHEFQLSDSEIIGLMTSLCFYCEAVGTIRLPSLVCSGKVPLNGIDRKDSSKGYIRGNCVACCTTCNMMKRERSVDDFIRQCRLVVATMTPG